MYSRYGNGRGEPSSLPQGYSGTAYTEEEPQDGVDMRTAGDMQVTVADGMKTYRARDITGGSEFHTSRSERIYRSRPAAPADGAAIAGAGAEMPSDNALTDNDGGRVRYPLEDSERYTAHRPPRSRRRSENIPAADDGQGSRRVRFPLERVIPHADAQPNSTRPNDEEPAKAVGAGISGEKSASGEIGELFESIFGKLSEHSFTLEDMLLIGLILLLLNEKADTETIVLLGLLLFSSF